MNVTIHTDRRAFTLVELLVVIAIIALVSSMTLFAFYGVREDAKERRARSQVARIHELLMQQWESYRTRAVPVRILPGTSPAAAALMRLKGIRALIRMELPDRKTDLMVGTSSLVSLPTLWKAYVRRARRQSIGDSTNMDGWTPLHQQAECLYLILAAMRDGDTTGLDSFTEGEIGDADNDGMPEILDPWGVPIYFLRWAPGFRSDIQPGDIEPAADVNAGNGNGDPFDPLKRDSRWRDNVGDNDPFLLYPLILSAGRDKQFDILFDLPSFTFDPSNPHPYPYDDPYYADAMGRQIGSVSVVSSDNITNHFLEVR